MREAAKAILLKNEEHLSTLSNELIPEIEKIIAGDWGLYKSNSNEKVDFLDIEVFADGYRLALYPMDKELTQLGYRIIFEENYANGILNEEELNPNLDEYNFQNENDNKDLDEFEEAQKEIFIKWLLSCWQRTDHSKLIVPVYITFHDGENSFDLKANKWVKKH